MVTSGGPATTGSRSDGRCNTGVTTLRSTGMGRTIDSANRGTRFESWKEASMRRLIVLVGAGGERCGVIRTSPRRCSVRSGPGPCFSLNQARRAASYARPWREISERLRAERPQCSFCGAHQGDTYIERGVTRRVRLSVDPHRPGREPQPTVEPARAMCSLSFGPDCGWMAPVTDDLEPDDTNPIYGRASGYVPSPDQAAVDDPPDDDDVAIVGQASAVWPLACRRQTIRPRTMA
jgi:hypothetical protein